MNKMANDSLVKQNDTLLEGRLTTFSPTECIAWITVLCTIGIATVTFNGLAVIVYLKEPSLHKRSMYLVISLAVADMFVGGVSLSIRVFNSGRNCSLWENYLSPDGESMLVAIVFLFVVASVTNLTAISLERMHATFRPFKHRILKKWIFRASVAATWFIAVINSSYMYLDVLFKVRGSWEFYLPLSIGLCCFIISLVSYLSIVVKIHCGTHPHNHGAFSRERKLTKTLFMATVVSLALMLPCSLSYFLKFSKTSHAYSRKISHLHFFVVSLNYANSLVNPILYAYRIPEFKRAISSFFRL